MPPKTKEQARANFENSAAYIPERYKAGIERADWKSGAESDAAEANFAAAMQNAIANRTRQNKIKSLTNEDWKRGAVSKGAPVIGERVRQSLGKWQTNWSPIYDGVLSVLPTLPSKTLDFRANINNRLVKVVEQWKRGAGKL